MKKIAYLIFVFLISFEGLSFSQYINEDWTIEYNVNDTNYVTDLKTDFEGNFYILLQSKFQFSDFDFVLNKYNSAGAEIWNRRYNGSANGKDVPIKLALDYNGNVYVAGWSLENNSNDDYTIIKYTSDGNEDWVSHYNGPANGPDWPLSMAIDSAGNVYVTGESLGNNSGWDIATIKLNNYGVQQWVQRYNGLLSQSDNGQDIAVDKKGNVYVTGSTTVGNKITNIITIKYDSKGNQKWVQQYNGNAQLDYNWNDAENITIDNEDNILVTGKSIGTNSGWDIITLKYNSSGKELWNKRFLGKSNSGGNSDQDLPSSIMTDSKGNVYIVGETGNKEDDYDFTVIKYNSSGVLQWVNTLDGGWAYDLLIDKKDNIYVTGSIFFMNSGNYSSYYCTIKYNPAGIIIWQQKYSDPNKNPCTPKRIAMDKYENIYVSGYLIKNKTLYDILTIKYSQDINNNNESQTFSEAQKAYNDGKFTLVLELLKDFPENSPLYDDALALMLKALGNIQSGSNQNFSTVYGKINCTCQSGISGYVIFEDLISGTQVGKCKIGSNGYYCIVLPSGKKYSYYIDAVGFYPLSRIADFTSPAQGLNLNDNITLVSLEEMTEQQVSIRINNIFFDFNESTLKPESFLELDRLHNVLNTNSDIKVEISGHTDNVGSDDYNNKLSQSRAESVKDYLVKKGINGSRIISKGYGKSNPVATNDTEEGRQLNRRVEFKILKK